jgi:hypothetical protein
MRKSILVALLFASLAATSAFAEQVDVDVDFNNLVSADEMSEVMSTDHFDDHFNRPRFFRCFAENRRGMRFEGMGRSPGEAQERALRQCYQRGSRTCKPMGCHRG